VNPRVKAVRPNPNHTLTLISTNSEVRCFDVKPYLKTGIFRDLVDLQSFNSSGRFSGALNGPRGKTSAPTRGTWIAPPPPIRSAPTPQIDPPRKYEEGGRNRCVRSASSQDDPVHPIIRLSCPSGRAPLGTFARYQIVPLARSLRSLRVQSSQRRRRGSHFANNTRIQFTSLPSCPSWRNVTWTGGLTRYLGVPEHMSGRPTRREFHRDRRSNSSLTN
jgi:hypothetical protein